MKKILAIFLTLTMLLSSTALFAMADEPKTQGAAILFGSADPVVVFGGDTYSQSFEKGSVEANDVVLADLSHDATDVTGMLYLVFEFHTTGDGLKFPLAVSLASGDAQTVYTATLNDFRPYVSDQNGWNTVVIPVTKFSGGDCNLTTVSAIKIYNHADFEASADSSVTIKNVRFISNTVENQEAAAENGALSLTTGGVNWGSGLSAEWKVLPSSRVDGGLVLMRYAHGGNGVTYNFNPTNVSAYDTLSFYIYVNNVEILQHTVFLQLTDGNGKNLEWRGDAFLSGISNLSAGWNKVTLSFEDASGIDNFDPTGVKKFYLRLQDIPDTVYGDKFTAVLGFDDVRFENSKLTGDAALDAAEEAGDENSISLFGCNTQWGNMTIDKQDKKAGSASASFTVGKSAVNQVILSTPVNGTGMDTLTFEMYVSDPALFDKFASSGMNSGLELTSSGKCDHSEIAWNLASIKSNNLGGEIVAGWNHIVLPLETAKATDGDTGAFDISAINYIRFFMVNETEDTGITVKMDNLRLDNSGLARAAAKLEADQKEADQVIALIDQIGTVTLESEDAIKAAEVAYAALTADQKALVTNKDAMTAARNAINALVEAENNKGDESKKDDEDKKDDENNGNSATEDESKKDETKDPSDDATPESPKAGNTVVIIVIVALVLVAAVVCVYFFVIKKKK